MRGDECLPLLASSSTNCDGLGNLSLESCLALAPSKLELCLLFTGVPGREGGLSFGLAVDGLGTLLPRLSELCLGLEAAGFFGAIGESRSLWVRGCLGLRGS